MLAGPTLRTIRAVRHVSQAELAEISGVSPSAIAAYESGKRNLRADTIRRLCLALRVNVVYHVDGHIIAGP